MSIQKEIHNALSRKEPLSAKEAQALLVLLFPALTEATVKQSAIHPGGGNIPMGGEYRKALETGTAADVERLQAEFRQASVEVAQLQAKRDALTKARNEARIREAMRDLPKMQAQFVASIEAAEAAQRALEAAFDGMQEAYNEVAHARATLNMAGMYGAGEGASQAVIGRMLALAPFAKARRVVHHPDGKMHCDRLGAPFAKSQAEWNEMQYPTPKTWVTG